MRLTSPAFQQDGAIPSKYTCDGAGVSPPLEISGVPAGSRSLALIVYDPDVPKSIKPDGRYTHWVLWNLPPGTTALEEHRSGGISENGQEGFIRPCPPNGEHRYIFQLFALDTNLDARILLESDLRRAMQGHIVEQAELVGRYSTSTSRVLNYYFLPAVVGVVLVALVWKVIANRARSTSTPR